MEPRLDWQGVAVPTFSREDINRFIRGERLANPSELWFRDPSYFRVGELHEHYEMWQQIAGDQPNPQQLHILSWIRDQVSIF